MMFRRMLADVVSDASPGSSDGGSVPQFTVIVSLSPLPLDELPPHAATMSTTRRARAEMPNAVFL